MQFTKMHGIGNDYVYINGFEITVHDPAALAIKVSDRHFGIGSDGLIMVLPPENGVDAHVRMRMFNADGSESEMCGNGIRCVAKFAHDRDITMANPMRVQTGNGVLSIDYTTDDQGKLALATVDMGEPILEPAKIPVALADVARIAAHPTGDLIDWSIANDWLDAAGLDTAMTCVSMGNPHVVFYVRDLGNVPLDRIGPVLENHPLFPKRINVHFVQVHSPGEVTVLHWERGSGVTLACGTGACAVCVAGVLTGKTNRTIQAHLPGGDLTLEWREADAPSGGHHVYMTGPATEVFTGDWPDS